MEKANIQRKIKNIIKEKFDIEQEIEAYVPLADIGIDSIKIIELVLAIEEHYCFEFEDDKLSYETLRNLNSIIEYVWERIVKK